MKNNRVFFAGLFLFTMVCPQKALTMFIPSGVGRTHSYFDPKNSGRVGMGRLKPEERQKTEETLQNLENEAKKLNVTDDPERAGEIFTNYCENFLKAQDLYAFVSKKKFTELKQKGEIDESTTYKKLPSAINDMVAKIVQLSIENLNSPAVGQFAQAIHESNVEMKREIKEKALRTVKEELNKSLLSPENSNKSLYEKIQTVYNTEHRFHYGFNESLSEISPSNYEGTETILANLTLSTIMEGKGTELVNAYNKLKDQSDRMNDTARKFYVEQFPDIFMEQFQRVSGAALEGNAPIEEFGRLMDKILKPSMEILTQDQKAQLTTDLVKQVERKMLTNKAFEDGLSRLSKIKEATGQETTTFNHVLETAQIEIGLKNLETQSGLQDFIQQNFDAYEKRIKDAGSTWSVTDSIKSKFQKIADFFTGKQRKIAREVAKTLDTGKLGDTQSKDAIDAFLNNEMSGESANYDAVASLLKEISKLNEPEASILLATEQVVEKLISSTNKVRTEVLQNLLDSLKEGGSLNMEDPVVTNVEKAFKKYTQKLALEKSKKSPSTENSFLGEVEAAGDEGRLTQSDADNTLAAQGNDILTTSSEARTAGQQNAAGSHSKTTDPNENRGSDTPQSGEDNNKQDGSSVDPTTTASTGNGMDPGQEKSRDGINETDTESDEERRNAEEAAERAKAEAAKLAREGQGEGESAEAGQKVAVEPTGV